MQLLFNYTYYITYLHCFKVVISKLNLCLLAHKTCVQIHIGIIFIHDYNKDLLTFRINDNIIEIFNSYRHLGHIINSDFDDNDDLFDKRNSVVGQANSFVLCYF